jgi:hypothetical protein
MRRISLATMIAVGLLGGAIGCGGGSSDYKKADDLKKAPAHDEHDEHGHGAKGPHGGSLVELGADEYHAEVVLDHDTHTVRVFVLGKDAKTAEPTAATEITLALEGKDAVTLKAVPQEGDGEGKASKFELVDEKVVHDLLDAKMIHGELQLAIGGTPYSGHVHYHLDDIHHEHKDDAKKDGAAKPAEGEKKDDAPKAEGETK